MKGIRLQVFRPRLLVWVLLAAAMLLGVRAVQHDPAVAATPAPVVMASVAPALPAAPAPAKSAAAPAHRAPAASAGNAGMRAYIDPETGRLGARPANAIEGDEFLYNDSDEGLVQQRMPDGSVMMDLQGRFQEFAVMTIGPDGKREMGCVRNPKIYFQNGPAAQPKPEER